jgi:hypothetical protein
MSTIQSPAMLDAEAMLLSEREASRALGVTARTLFTLRQGGEITHCKIGARVMYAPDDLRDFIQRRRIPAGK